MPDFITMVDFTVMLLTPVKRMCYGFQLVRLSRFTQFTLWAPLLSWLVWFRPEFIQMKAKTLNLGLVKVMFDVCFVCLLTVYACELSRGFWTLRASSFNLCSKCAGPYYRWLF